MSLALAEAELKRFLESAEPQVFCLSGRWGVGKTYAWSKVLKDKAIKKAAGFDNYSYVSLFGIETLERLRTSVFENSVSIKDDEKDRGRTINFVKNNWKKHLKHVQELPGLKDFVPDVEPYLFNFVHQYIVCFDDLERKSDDLSIRDVLGLVSFLKEQKKCKVVIVLNTDALDNDEEEFRKYFEKVVDVNIFFDPTPEESASAALPTPKGATSLLKENVIRLGMTNIRVIKKIERFVVMLEKVLEGRGEAALRQAVHSAALLGWSIYEPEHAPTIDFMKARERRAYSSTAEKLSSQEVAWDKLLNDYEFGAIDQFDWLIVHGLRSGYFAAEEIDALAREMDQRVEKERLRERFNKAWDVYHSSLNPARDGFVDELYASASKAAAVISPMELNGTVDLIRVLERPDLATALINTYVNETGRLPEFFGLNGPFGSYVTDQEVRAAFEAKHVTTEDTRGIIDVLRKMVELSGWNPGDISRLTAFTADQYYDAISNYVGKDLNLIIRFALDFRDRGEVSIAERMEEALRRIGREGPVQSRRIAAFELPPEGEVAPAPLA